LQRRRGHRADHQPDRLLRRVPGRLLRRVPGRLLRRVPGRLLRRVPGRLLCRRPGWLHGETGSVTVSVPRRLWFPHLIPLADRD
jgi:hypothetical protein